MGTKIASRLLILVLAAATLAGGGIHTDPRTAPVVVGQGIRVFGADPEHERLVRWAFSRYERAGLDAPAVDVHFHADTSGCYGHLGAELGGRVDYAAKQPDERAVLRNCGDRHRRRGAGKHGRIEFRLRQHGGGDMAPD